MFCPSLQVNLSTPAAKVRPPISGCHGYLWQKSSSDIMAASEPRPLGGALKGTDQWGWWAVGIRGFWKRAVGGADGVMWGCVWFVVLGWASMIGWPQEGVISDPAPGQDSLTPDRWPLSFLRSRNTTSVSGGLATNCRVLRGRGGVDGGRPCGRERGTGSERGEDGWVRPEIFFFTLLNISKQSQSTIKNNHPIRAQGQAAGTWWPITNQTN